MAFNVSYNFIALNQFSGTAKKIAKSAKNISKNIKPIGKNLVSLKKISKVSTQSIRSDLIKTASVGSASFNKINDKSNRFRSSLKRLKNIRPFKKIQSGLTKLRRGFRRLRTDAKKTGKSIAGSFRGLVLGAGLALGVKKFIDVGADFQDSLVDLSIITGATGKDLNLLSSETLRLAKSSAIAQTEVAAAAKIVGSQKSELLKNIPALIATTEQVLLLKNAAGIELADAAEIATTSLNIFGKEASSIGKFIDIMAAGAVVGASEIGQTGQAIIIAGGAARSAGLSFKDLNVLLQVTSKGGFKAAQAGTALNAILGRLQRGKKGVFAGIDFEKTDLQSIFLGIKKVLDNMPNSVARAQLATELFGEEHQKVAFALLNNATLINQFSKAMDENGLAQKQADQRLSSFNSKMRKLGVIIKDRVIRVFNRMEPVLTRLATKFGDFIDSITPEQLNKFGDALKIFIKDAVVIGQKIGKVLKLAFTAENIKEFRSELGNTLEFLDKVITAGKVIGSIFKGFGTRIGESVGQIQTGDVGKDITPFREAFSVDKKLFGLFENKINSLPGNVVDFPKLINPLSPETIIKGIVSLFSKKAIPNNVVNLPVVLPTPEAGPSVTSLEESKSTIDINLNAPPGVIKEVKTSTSGSGKRLNVGVNMKEAG